MAETRMTGTPVEIVCPKDSTVLHWDDAGLTCPRCGADWERDGRIPLFVADPEAAAACTGAPVPEGPEPNTDWRFLLPLTAESRVLVVGFGAGRVTAELAPDVHSVTVLHGDLATLRALEERTRDEGLGNVVPVLAPDALPFPDGSFHLIVLDDSTLPRGRKEQRERLRALRAKLTAAGHLFMPTPNRFGRLFPGHARKAPHPGAHGLDGWRKLLTECGFGDLDFHAAFPDARAPRELLPLDDPAAFEWWLRERADAGHGGLSGPILKQAFRAGLVARLVPHYAVVARGGSAR